MTGNSASRPLLITGGRVIDSSQGFDGLADLLIADGKIAWLSSDGKSPQPANCDILDAKGLIVSPGFIDLHTHLREPGFEVKETIASGTLAAARGGFTTVCCMPNTDPPLDSAGGIEFVMRKAATEGAVRVLPIGCITKGRKGEELAEMGELAEAGAVAFSDDGSPVSSARLMRHALEYSLAFGLPIIDHCEDLSLTSGGQMNDGWIATRLGLAGMPAAAEEVVVARDIALAGLTGARIHIAHVSCAGAVDLVRRAKERGLRVTAEVTPHHLTMNQEWVMCAPGGIFPAYDTRCKVNPPLRSEEDRQALIAALREGVIDAIATDHAPHTATDKNCEFANAAFGISGLETALGSLMGLVERGHLGLPLLISRLTVGPARIIRGAVGVPEGIGTLAEGAPADVAIIDPGLEWEVTAEGMASKGKNTPLLGTRLKGKVVATIVGGSIVNKEALLKVESRASA